MITGIIGKKIGMTQLFDEDGTVHPATVIKAGPCVVVQTKTAPKDGYDAVQLGLVEGRPAKVTKPVAGLYKRAGVPPTKVRREVRVVAGGDPAKPGDQVLVSLFAAGEQVDVIGTSRGRGYQGVVKRHHFAAGEQVDVIGTSRGRGYQGVVKRHHFRGGEATHGSMFHRAPGSIGASSFPSRVIKGMRMAGRMGGDRVTVRNLKVLRVDPANHLLVVEGAVPGAPGGYLVVRKAAAPHRGPQPLPEKPAQGKK